MVELVEAKHIFIRQYLKLYLDPQSGYDPRTDSVCGKPSGYTDQNQDQNQQQPKNIIIVFKDDRDCIDPETGEFYIGFNTCDINVITSKISLNSKIV